MSRHPFGWSYPPGAAGDPNAPWNQEDGPCECCGHDPADCICPECQICGEQGNPRCYSDPPLMRQVLEKHGIERPKNHGLKFNNQQRIGQSKMRIADLREQIQDEELALAYLEEHTDEDLS